jgi:hypothetical protein
VNTRPKSTKKKKKAYGRGIRGSRGKSGNGWLIKYREGLGGHHLQGRWNLDLDKEEARNDEVFNLSPETQKVFFELEYEEGTDPDSFKVGRVEAEIISGLLPLTCANLASRLSAVGTGVVEKVEKGVGVVFSTEDSLTENHYRLKALDKNEERNAAE